MSKDISIYVENFGPIKGPETIYLRPFMILSGLSGVGKSYMAMLIHYVYRVICGDELQHYLSFHKVDYDRLTADLSGDDVVLLYTISTEDLKEWINRQALQYMRNMLGNSEFSAQIGIELPDLPTSFDFLYIRNTVRTKDGNELETIETLTLTEGGYSIQFARSQSGALGNYPFFFLLTRYFREKYHLNPDKTFFMPPSRGSLVAVPDSLRIQMQQTMGMYQEFLDDLSALKNRRPNQKQSELISQANQIMHQEILHGDIHIRENELVYQLYENSAPIPITSAASSIKEISPFALMIQKGWLGSYAVLFEEPESHLHPEMQLRVADLLAYSLKEGAHLQVTTHSDYLLRHINDLIRLHILREKMNDESRFEDYCLKNGFNPTITIDPKHVRAYYLFMKNGYSCIKEQDISLGVPFNSFEYVMKEQVTRSAQLYDLVEFYVDTESHDV